MSQAVIIMGVSSCGKSTVGRALAKDAGGCFIEGDDFHPAANVKKMRDGIPLQDADRREWLRRMRAEIDRRCTRGSVCFVACSALKKSYRDFLRRAKVDVQFVFLTGSPELIRQRMEKRKGHFMPPALLRSQFATLEPPRDAVVADITPPPEEISRLLLARLGIARQTEDQQRRCNFPTHTPMKNHVYKLIELTGTSTTSIEDAINTAIKRAGKKVKNLRWFVVTETRGDIDKNQVSHWQVTIKVGFTVED
jgi:carbohydrate kinase (thermoresistant glucokinase family)